MIAVSLWGNPFVERDGNHDSREFGQPQEEIPMFICWN